jgi:hypothetical protein
LRQREEYVRDVGHVPGEQARFDTAADVADDDLAYRGGRAQLLRPRIEVGERPGEHDVGEDRMVEHEPAVDSEQASEVGARIAGARQFVEAAEQPPESLEVHLADQAGPVAEQLVHGRDRGGRLVRDLPRRETGDAVLAEHRDGGPQYPFAQFRRAQLGSRHASGSARRQDA